MKPLQIGEVARRAGIRTSAIRYYESIGLLPEPSRINGRRCYDESILQRLAVLQLAQRAGLTIAEIQTLFHSFSPDTPPAIRWQALAHQKLEEVEALIAQAQQRKQFLTRTLHCGCGRLEECVSMWEAECNQPEQRADR
jgi:MerR family transcriptional regulator, redox-sensitive transcriptional activator SoxR